MVKKATESYAYPLPPLVAVHMPEPKAKPQSPNLIWFPEPNSFYLKIISNYIAYIFDKHTKRISFCRFDKLIESYCYFRFL